MNNQEVIMRNRRYPGHHRYQPIRRSQSPDLAPHPSV